MNSLRTAFVGLATRSSRFMCRSPTVVVSASRSISFGFSRIGVADSQRRFGAVRGLHTPPVLDLPSPAAVRQSLSPKLKELLASYASLLDIPVQWGEQDTFGHVNNVSYLRYFESARLAYFNHILKPHLSTQMYMDFVTGKGVGPIVKSITITYRAPMWYPDIVTVGTDIRASDIQKDRFVQTFVMVSRAQERIVAEGNAVVVLYDYNKHAKAEIPEEILAAYRKGNPSNSEH